MATSYYRVKKMTDKDREKRHIPVGRKDLYAVYDRKGNVLTDGYRSKEEADLESLRMNIRRNDSINSEKERKRMKAEEAAERKMHEKA